MKKIALVLILFIAIAGFLFFLLSTYFHLSIVNYSGKRIVVDRVVVGTLPLRNELVPLEPRESYSMAAFKFSEFPILFVEMDDKGIKKNASCVLDVVDSDSCRVGILSDGTLDCSECYK